MGSVNSYELLLEIANCKESDCLPEDIRNKLSTFKAERESEIRKRSEEARKMESEIAEKKRKEAEDERRRLLCIGEWGEKIPRERRFALCYRMGKKFVGWIGQEKDPSKWAGEPEYCAIDIVRGVKNPYWHYYGTSCEAAQRDAFYNECVKPALECPFNDLVSEIRRNWDFFKMRSDELDDKFYVLKYHVEKGNGIPWGGYGRTADKVVIDDIGECKTLAEHQSDLKKEFCV